MGEPRESQELLFNMKKACLGSCQLNRDLNDLSIRKTVYSTLREQRAEALSWT